MEDVDSSPAPLSVLYDPIANCISYPAIESLEEAKVAALREHLRRRPKRKTEVEGVIEILRDVLRGSAW